MNNSRIYSIVVFCLYMHSLAGFAQAASQDKQDWDRLAIQLGCDNSSQISAHVQPANTWNMRQDSAAALNSAPASDRPLQAFSQSEQTLIPLPSGEMTGLAGLAALALVRSRRTLRRFFS